jgi:hypothetical protein
MIQNTSSMTVDQWNLSNRLLKVELITFVHLKLGDDVIYETVALYFMLLWLEIISQFQKVVV